MVWSAYEYCTPSCLSAFFCRHATRWYGAANTPAMCTVFSATFGSTLFRHNFCHLVTAISFEQWGKVLVVWIAKEIILLHLISFQRKKRKSLSKPGFDASQLIHSFLSVHLGRRLCRGSQYCIQRTGALDVPALVFNRTCSALACQVWMIYEFLDWWYTSLLQTMCSIKTCREYMNVFIFSCSLDA